MRRVILISLLVSQIIVNCDNRSYDAYNPSIPPLEFSEDLSYDLSFGYSSQSSYIPFKANYTWIAELDASTSDWVVIHPTGGGLGNDTVYFSLSENVSGSDRRGFLTLYSGDTTYVFTIRQVRSLSFLPCRSSLCLVSDYDFIK